MNDSLKKAQANYQEKCRILNLRINKETEPEIMEWLDIMSNLCGITPAIKTMIVKDYRRMKEHKTRVNFYSAQVKYHRAFEDYTSEEFLEMAKAKADHGIDTFDHDIITNEIEARKIDGKVEVINQYPGNKIAVVNWSYIDDLYWEEGEDE